MSAEQEHRVLCIIQGVLIGARHGIDAVADDACDVGMPMLGARLSDEADRLLAIQQDIERFPNFVAQEAEEADDEPDSA